MSDASENLVVRIERSRTARAFDLKGESLWEKELGRIYTFLSSHIEALKRTNPEKDDLHRQSWKDDTRPILSIAIFGTHGSGKSSLLKTLVEDVNSSRLQPERQKRLPSEGLYALPVIEPAALSEDEHFLYTFLATALEEDLNRQRAEERAPSASRTLTPVQQVFQEVSEYLQVIDKMERPSEHDPLGHSLERLDRHTSGLLLRRKLSQFHDHLANRLAPPSNDRNASLVLLPVDDADLSLERLVATLETYRRYLQHPRLVPVFTFTGRLAEELLRVHFARNLLLEESRKLFKEKTFTSPSVNREMPEQLAVQYLAKLFPIRNRIRLGPAPARVQGALYELRSEGNSTPDGQKRGQKEVWYLLEAASHLLFGYPEWPIAPRIRLALRPPTLLRQLQVLDAMQDAWLPEVLALQEQPLAEGQQGVDGTPSQADLRCHNWVEIFDKAAWSLINVHRDIVREFRMQIEELHSLTPRNLSREILSSVLSLELETRRELLQRWRLQVEDLRGQILSLLALNAFRPHMKGEELSGDDPDAIRLRQQTGSGTGERKNSLSALKGLLWFLDLWIGFYLPQVLARDRPNDIAEKDHASRSVRGVGWDLRSGPRHAMAEVLFNRHISATGMMLIDPDNVSEALENQNNKDAALAIHLWCFVGYRRGRPWAAVSFWRVLGLIGQIVEDYQREVAGLDLRESSAANPNLVERIKVILSRHCETVREPGSFQEGGTFFAKWGFPKDQKSRLHNLAERLKDWLDRHYSARIIPVRGIPRGGSDNAAWWQDAFQESFVRRLHGEFLLGKFWPDMGGAYLEGPADTGDEDSRWDAWSVLEGWTRVLMDYFAEVKIHPSAKPKGKKKLTLEALFEECPLLDFAHQSANIWNWTEVKKEFQALRQVRWKDSPYFEPEKGGDPPSASDGRPGNGSAG